MLQVLGVFQLLAVDEHLTVDDLQRLARHADESLHVVLAAIHGAGNHFAEGLLVAPHPVASIHLAEGVVVGVLAVHADGVAVRVVEDHDVVALHLRQARHAPVVHLRMVKVALAEACRAYRHRVLEQRQRQGCHRHTWAVMIFRHKQVVTRHHRLFERSGRDLEVLEEEVLQHPDGSQGEHDGIHPRHHATEEAVLDALPPVPLDESGPVHIGNKR